MSGRAASGKLDSLTSIRFFAALWVVLFHTGRTALSGYGVAVQSFVESGYAAVGLFFILSGFVLAYNYAPKAPLNKRTFWSARFARIAPAYALSLLLMLPMFIRQSHAGHYTDAQQLGSVFTVPLFLQAWFPSLALTWNSPAWSLSAEAFFYLAFPFLVAPISRLRRPQRWGVSLLLFLAAIVPSLLFCHFSQPSWGALLKFEITDWNLREGGGALALINFCPLLRLAEFAVGIVLGCSFLERKPVKPEAASTLRWELLAILSGLVPIALLSQPHVLPYPIIHNGILLPVWACLIYSLAASSRIRGVLSTKWLLLLGEASYGFYILQYPLSTMYKTALLYLFHLDVHGSYPTLPLLAGYLVILSVASIVSYRYLEAPGRRALMRWFSRPAVTELAYSVAPAVSR